MFARRREIGAVRGTADLHQALRPATHAADRLIQRRTRAPGLSLPANRTRHHSSFAQKGLTPVEHHAARTPRRGTSFAALPADALTCWGCGPWRLGCQARSFTAS